MKTLLTALCVLVAASVCQAEAPIANLSMVYSNAIGDDLPFAIFTKKNWAPDPKARFVKLHFYFDEPILAKRVTIDTCESRFGAPISLFFNFDEKLLSMTPQMSLEFSKALIPVHRKNLLVLEGLDDSVEARSLTFNFERNSGFKICGIKIANAAGEAYQIKTPLLDQGTVEASSVLPPLSAYDPIFLFDSRFEYGWAANKKAKDVNLKFRFSQAKRIEKLRIWNGYQRSVNHCFENSRARTLKLSGSNGYTATVAVQDTLGSQVVALPTAFEGQDFTIEVADAYLGKTYADLVISELRFFDGKDWFMLDPTAKLKAAIARNHEEFSRAHLAGVLNDSIDGYQGEGISEGEATSILMRLRADGSAYIAGSDDSGDDTFFALGNYEIKEASAKQIRLRVFGLYNRSKIYGDCNGCGRDCNIPEVKPREIKPGEDSLQEITTQKIFQEFLILKPAGNGTVEITNESKGRILKFKNRTLSRTKE
jgi:hypothetical protein